MRPGGRDPDGPQERPRARARKVLEFIGVLRPRGQTGLSRLLDLAGVVAVTVVLVVGLSAGWVPAIAVAAAMCVLALIAALGVAWSRRRRGPRRR